MGESLLSIYLQGIVVFLENRGRNLIEMPESDISGWLRTNGFVGKRSWKQGDYYFIEIDETQMTLSEFYSFEQLTLEQTKGTEECWRTFFCMDSETEEKDSWNETIEEPFGKPLKYIQLKQRS